MSDSSKKRVRSRNDVKAAFSNLIIPPGMSDKEKELYTRAHEATRSSIADVAVDTAAQAITAAGLRSQKALSAVNEELQNKLQLLSDVNVNIELSKEELVRLAGARIITEHLDVLKAEHDEAMKVLERQISDAKAAWAEEKEQHEDLMAERDIELKKAREREQADYEYNLKNTRKLNFDLLTEEVRVKRAAEQATSEQKNKEWATREEVLAKAELELKELREKAQGHQTEIDKAVKTAVAIETNRLTREHLHEKQLLEKDRTSEKALYEADKKSLQDALGRANKLNEELQTALALAHSKNVEVANKALDATSSQKALDAVQNLIKDQGTNGPAKRS